MTDVQGNTESAREEANGAFSRRGFLGLGALSLAAVPAFRFSTTLTGKDTTTTAELTEITEFPVGYFLEAVAVRADGSMLGEDAPSVSLGNRGLAAVLIHFLPICRWRPREMFFGRDPVVLDLLDTASSGHADIHHQSPLPLEQPSKAVVCRDCVGAIAGVNVAVADIAFFFVVVFSHAKRGAGTTIVSRAGGGLGRQNNFGPRNPAMFSISTSTAPCK